MMKTKEEAMRKYFMEISKQNQQFSDQMLDYIQEKSAKEEKKHLIDYISQKVLNVLLIIFGVIFTGMFIWFVWFIIYVSTF